MAKLVHDRIRFPVTRFQIAKWVLGKVPSLEITRYDYIALKRSRQVISYCLSFESAFDFVVECYRELEQNCLDMAFKSALNSDAGWHEFIDDMQLVDRRVFALLSSAKAYIDRGRSLAKKIGKQDLLATFDHERSNQFDQYFSYRFLEALRNHSRHAGVSVNSIVRHNSVETLHSDLKDGELQRLVLTGRPMLNCNPLVLNENVRRGTRDEVRQKWDKNERIDLMPHVRQYVSSLANIQNRVRDEYIEKFNSSSELIDELINRYVNEHGDSILGLSCSAVGNEGIASGHDPLLREPSDRVKHLIKKNQRVDKIHEYIFSSEPPKHMRKS